MPKRKGLLIFALVLILSSFTVPAFGADSISVNDSLTEIVSYYANNKTDLDNWEEVVGLVKAGEDPSAAPWNSPDWGIASLESSSSGTYATTILGMLAAGQDPTNVDGRNLVQELAFRQTETGAFGEYITDTIWAMIALDEAHGSYDINEAAAYLINQKTADGGFALSGDTADPDMTGFVLMALAPHNDIEGVSDAVSSAKLSLQNMQLDNGGFSSWGTENAETIATVIRGLIACGEDITTDTWKNGKMIDALFDFQLDDKSFSHTIDGSHNDIATRQALVAVADMVNASINYQIGQSDQPGGESSEEVSVRVRVEGTATRLADQTVTVQGTAFNALTAAVGENNVQLDQYGMVGTILGESGQDNVDAGTNTSWMYYVIRDGAIDPAAFSQGSNSYNIKSGDQVVFYIGAYDSTTWDAKTYFPEISITPTEPVQGQSLVLNITARKSVWGLLQDLTQDEIANIGDYIVKVGVNEYTSSCGIVTIPNISQGVLEFTITNSSPAGYPDVITYAGSIQVKGATGGGPVVDNSITVSIAVVGKGGNLIYRPGSVQIAENAEFGLTAMSALAATGISYELSSRNDGMVVSIAGEANEGMNGWCGKVNSTSFWDVPGEIPLSEGDKIIFWYSIDANFNGPKWEDLLSGNIVQITASAVSKDEIKDTLNSYSEELNKFLKTIDSKESTGTMKTLNADHKMSQEAAKALKQELDNNRVTVSETVDRSGAVLGDTEVSMLIPENALPLTAHLSIKELDSSREQQANIKIGSSVYEFGPDGTRFDIPVTISLKVPITEDLNVDQLTPAWYDEESQQWIPIPAIADLKTGLVVFKINHFTKFALIESPAPIKEPEVIKENRKTFTDVTEDIAWAKDAIEILAGRGIIQGTGKEVFEPQRPISRAEFVKLGVTALQLKTEEYKNGLFKDVYDSDWFAPSVATACHNRIVSGYPDGTFKPNQSISRNEIASIFYQIEGGHDIGDIKLTYHDLSDIPAWTLNGVKYMNKQGLMSGYENGTFRGQNQLTRAEAAVVIYKYVNLVPTL